MQATLDQSELGQKIQARLTELKDMRQKYFIDAEKNLAAYDAAIAELTKLLQPEPVTEQGATNA